MTMCHVLVEQCSGTGGDAADAMRTSSGGRSRPDEARRVVAHVMRYAFSVAFAP